MLKEGDFLLVELEGRDEEGKVFDSTKGEVAIKLHGREKPLLIVYGKAVMIPGLRKLLENMKEGEEKEVTLPPEEAFGRRRKDLIKIMSLNDFKKFGVNPKPGELIHLDTDKGRIYGVVKSVTSGRVMVDFNHPMAGKTVHYRIKLLKIIREDKEKVKALLEDMGMKGEVKKEGEKIVVSLSAENEDDFERKKALLLINVKYSLPNLKIEVVRK